MKTQTKTTRQATVNPLLQNPDGSPKWTNPTAVMQRGDSVGIPYKAKPLKFFAPVYERTGERDYTDTQKRAAAIIDQLGPVFMADHPKHYISPELFKKLTLRLAELLP